MSPRNRIVRRMLACGLTGASVASAADPATEPAKPDYSFTLGGTANYAADADLHDGGGSFSVFRSGGSLSIDHPLSPVNSISLGLDGEYSHYFFRDIGTVPGDDGHDSLDVYQFTVRPTFTHFFNDHFGVYGGVTLGVAGESDVDFSDAATYGAFGGVTYKLGSGVWVGFGVGFTTQLEDNAFVVPLLTVNWDISPQLKFTAEGLSAKLTYRIDESWSVFGKAEYAFRQYRLSSDAVLSDGVLTDQSVPLTVGVTYRPDAQLSITAEAGVVAWRRLEFRDDGGHEVGADEADPAAFVGVSVQYAF